MRVAVVGGGMAGLSAALTLLDRGADPTVFEASPRPGGKVGTTREQGWLTEDGPNFLARPLDAFLTRVGLGGDVVPAAGPKTRWVHLGGRVLRAPSPALLARLNLPRALLEPFFARKLVEDRPLLDLLVARLGTRTGSLAARVLAAGVYAGDPALLSARDAFPSLGAIAARGSLLLGSRGAPPRTPTWSLRGGLGSLADAAARILGGRIRLGARVASLRARAGGFLVGGESFDAAVVAVPAGAAAALLEETAPAFAQAMDGETSATVSVVHLGFPASDLPRGFGIIDADGSLNALGTLFPSSMLPGRAPEGFALATAIVGGATHPERAQPPDNELVGNVVSDLRRLLGVRSRPVYRRIVRWAEGIPQVAPGHRERIAAARAALAGFPRLAVAGAAYDGVSVPEVIASGARAGLQVIA